MSAALTHPDAALAQALGAWETAYWRDVDRNWGRQAHAAFVENGVLEIAGRRLAGRAAIQQLYAWRERRGERIARHVVTNFPAEALAGSRARLECICLLYAADGVPVLPSRPANVIADLICTYEREPGGGWRAQERVFRALFAGDIPATVPAG